MVDSVVNYEEARKAAEQEAAAEEFKKKLIVADGELISLAKPGPNGEKLFIAARFYKIPGDEIDLTGTWYDPASSRYFGDKIPDGLFLVDIHARKDGNFFPIGKVDWEKHGEEALPHANTRRVIRVTNEKEQEKLAREYWGEKTKPTIVVLEEFENMGLGTLLLAASALVLNNKGARYFSPTVLLPGSVQGAIGKFVNIDKVVNVEGYAYPKKGRIDEYFESPKFNQAFKDFAVPKT